RGDAAGRACRGRREAQRGEPGAAGLRARMARRVGERPIDAGPPPRRQTQRAGPALRLPDAAGDDPTFAEEADIDEICGSRAIAEDRLGRSRIDRYLDLAAVRNEARAQARIVK